MQSSHGEELGIGDKIAGRYEVLSILGKGSMGVVYKTRDERLGRVVAIKTLRLQRSQDERTARRFEREARVSCMMEHPNLITVFDFGHTPEGIPYLIMDYVQGLPLYNIIKQERCLAPERAVYLYSQVCDGLYHAHQRGVIHRDLKPANVIVVKRENEPESVKIVDLGVAKIVHSSEDETEAITRTGEVCGSPIYLSPEQCMYQELDARSDIYSLGVCLYESLTGVPPLRGATVYDTIYMHVHEMPRPFSVVAPDIKIPKRLEDVVFRCLSKRPAERYETMQQVKNDLIRALKEPEAPGQEAVFVMPPEQFFADRVKPASPSAPPNAPALPREEPKMPGANVALKEPAARAQARPHLDDYSSDVPGRRSSRVTLWDTLNKPVLTKERGSALQIFAVFLFGAVAMHLFHTIGQKPAVPAVTPTPVLVNTAGVPGQPENPTGSNQAPASSAPAKPQGKAQGKLQGQQKKTQPQAASKNPDGSSRPATAQSRPSGGKPQESLFAEFGKKAPGGYTPTYTYGQVPEKQPPLAANDPSLQKNFFSPFSFGNQPAQQQSPAVGQSAGEMAKLPAVQRLTKKVQESPRAQAALKKIAQNPQARQFLDAFKQANTQAPPMQPQMPKYDTPAPVRNDEPGEMDFYTRAEAASRSGDWASAVDLYEKCYNMNPTYPMYVKALSTAHYNYAEVLRRQSQYPAALNHANRACELNPQNDKFSRLKNYLEAAVKDQSR